ncbi:MAG TPA: hypothetical protein VHK91_04340 [Flavisolibacter sp.]|nr:hypothetical protein [Flavisolibacter sp.]
MKYIFSFLLVVLVISARAQDEGEQKGFRKDKLFVGGNFGVSIGDYTLINVSPQVGYRFSKLFAAGIGLNGQYISDKQRDYYGNPYYKTSQGIIGLNVFGRIYPFQYLMLQVQPEANYRFGKIRFYDNTSPQTTKLDAVIVPSILAGGGLVLPSGNGAFIASVFYDVLQDVNSPYGKKAFLNFGYNISLR